MRELLLFCLLIVLAKVCQPFSFQSSNSVTKVATSNVNSNIFVWKSNWNVHYVNVGSSGPPLLLVPGFGVGTFHYDHQLEELSKQYRVFSFDLLGQGQSWPQDGIVKEDDSLCYSADLWLEQVIYLIETVIKEPVHIAGNSLGGYLALATASKRPDLIKSLVLLNAAPFWSFAAPREESGAIRPSLLLPWNGVLPAPRWILDFGSRYFDLMRDPKNVNTMLKTVYATPTGFDQELIDNILTSANRPGGQEAFTSILFSPKMRESFDEMLGKVSCPVCLIYGKEDPWIGKFSSLTQSIFIVHISGVLVLTYTPLIFLMLYPLLLGAVILTGIIVSH